MRPTWKNDPDSLVVVLLAAAAVLALGACGARSVGPGQPDGGGDAGVERPASGNDGQGTGGSDAPPVACGASSCGPGQVCCTDCDGNQSCGLACPGSVCPPRDGGSDRAPGWDGGARSCSEAGGTCFCVLGPPPGYQTAPEPLRSSCPQPPPGSGACAQACYLPVSAMACTDKGPACPSGTICDLGVPGLCLASTAGGTCIVRPTSCPQGVDPVCGCDGKTYDSDCLRQMAGVQLDHRGGCVPGASCGASRCGAGQSCCTDCAGNRFCEAGGCSAVPSPCQACAGSGTCPIGSYCATSTAGDFRTRCNPRGSGYCAPRPSMCMDTAAPVCGCDGRTYGTDCLRRMAGVNLSHAGACP